MRLSQLRHYVCALAGLGVGAVLAQSSISISTVTSTSGITVSTSGVTETTLPTGSYISYSSTITSTQKSIYGTMTNGASGMGAENVTSVSQTVLQGTISPTISIVNGTISISAATSATASSTASSVQPINTTPCNNYPEFCYRKYSNITMVCAHNSPFDMAGNLASNQERSVTIQLEDGIRMLQAQAHIVNGTVYLCHTSCDILNAGTLESYLITVREWVQSHPYDVVTILIGNGDYSPVSDFVAPIHASGIDQFVYTPPKIPMALDDWPTLSSMILSGQRVVMFMDYYANQTEVPWILDEFSQMWETPFDPTNRSFPCTVQRPPDLSAQDTPNRLYLMNHNLNQEVSLLGNTILIPLIPLLNATNNFTGEGSVGEAAATCMQDWGRAPNFLNVDFYDKGNGSVFQAAANLNNVTYNDTCCVATSMAERTIGIVGMREFAMAALAFSMLWLTM